MFTTESLSSVIPEPIASSGAAAGVSPEVSRADHKHILPIGTLDEIFADNDLTITDHEIDFIHDWTPPATAPKIIGSMNAQSGFDYQTFRVEADGTMYWGKGTDPLDTSLQRGGDNLLQVAMGDDFEVLTGDCTVGGDTYLQNDVELGTIGGGLLLADTIFFYGNAGTNINFNGARYLTAIDRFNIAGYDVSIKGGQSNHIAGTGGDVNLIGGDGPTIGDVVSDGDNVIFKVNGVHVASFLANEEFTFSNDTDHILRMSGDSTMWDDVRVPLLSAKLGGITDPNLAKVKDDGAGSVGVYAYHFDKAKDEELFFFVELPHSVKIASQVSPHVHWSPIDGNAGEVIFELEFTAADVNGTFGNTTVITVLGECNGVAYKNQLVAFADQTGGYPSRSYLCRIARLGTDVADTYDNDVIIYFADFHFEMDTLGTRTSSPTDK